MVPPLPVGSQLAYEEYCGNERSASRLYPFYSAGRLQVDQESDQQAVLSRFEAFRGVQRLQRGRKDAQQVAAADRPQRDNFEPTTLQLRRRQGSAFAPRNHDFSSRRAVFCEAQKRIDQDTRQATNPILLTDKPEQGIFQSGEVASEE